MKWGIAVLIAATLSLTGCASASYQRREVQDDSGDRISVGTVQRKISVGMTSAQVIEILGSPNVVSTDEERREVWVYDKIATDTVYSESDAGIKFLTVGSSGARSTSQRTLTIIIKFDTEDRVRDFSYHTSRF
jgi:outer membrane protein assembly factor BamE (lipoprotein component of BamABCDE complex)